MKKMLFVVVIIMATLSPYQKMYSQGYAASIKVGSLGFTAEGIGSLGSHFNGRVGVSLFNYSMNGGGGSADDFKYAVKAKLNSISALVDYVPFQKGLRLTTGVVFNLNKLGTVLTPTKTYSSGGDIYTPEKLGIMNADIAFQKVAPYFGIGFGNPTFGNSGIGMTFEIGTYYLGAANVDLKATGLIAPSAAPDQQELIRNNLSWAKWYPVISLGLTYKI